MTDADQNKPTLRDFVEARKNYLPPADRRAAREHPSGWEPGVRWEGTEGEIISRPQADPNPHWEELLASWGFDPDKYKVLDDTIEFRCWDANLGRDPDTQKPQVQTLYYFKAKIVAKVPGLRTKDVDYLLADIRKFKPRKPLRGQITNGVAMVACLSDWQLGKADGDGTEGTVRRILASLDGLVQRLREMKKVGRPVETLYLALLGDITENCWGNYESQTFTVELNRRDQELLALDLAMRHVTTLAPLVDKLVITAVGGNHGENRKNGKSSATDDGDNSDVALAEKMAIVTSHNKAAFDNVSYVIPDDELVVVLDVAGTTVAFTHGHLARSGAGSTKKQESWWQGQVWGNKAAADAQVLVTAHYHHFASSDFNSRTWFQAPTQDGASKWFDDMTGCGGSPTGMLTLCFSNGNPGRWHDLQIV